MTNIDVHGLAVVRVISSIARVMQHAGASTAPSATVLIIFTSRGIQM
jgi:hypothetical protein